MKFIIKETYNLKSHYFFGADFFWMGGSKNRKINLTPRTFDRFVQNFSHVPYSGIDAILRPANFLNCIRIKFIPVSNTALIYGERPPSILLPHWMQFRSEQLIIINRSPGPN